MYVKAEPGKCRELDDYFHMEMDVETNFMRDELFGNPIISDVSESSSDDDLLHRSNFDYEVSESMDTLPSSIWSNGGSASSRSSMESASPDSMFEFDYSGGINLGDNPTDLPSFQLLTDDEIKEEHSDLLGHKVDEFLQFVNEDNSTTKISPETPPVSPPEAKCIDDFSVHSYFDTSPPVNRNCNIKIENWKQTNGNFELKNGKHHIGNVDFQRVGTFKPQNHIKLETKNVIFSSNNRNISPDSGIGTQPILTQSLTSKELQEKARQIVETAKKSLNNSLKVQPRPKLHRPNGIKCVTINSANGVKKVFKDSNKLVRGPNILLNAFIPAQKINHSVIAQNLNRALPVIRPPTVTNNVNNFPKPLPCVKSIPINKIVQQPKPVETIPITKIIQQPRSVDSIPFTKIIQQSKPIESIPILNIQQPRPIESIPITKIIQQPRPIARVNHVTVQKRLLEIPPSPIAIPPTITVLPPPIKRYTPVAPAINRSKHDHTFELRVLKRQQRMIRNRESASISRKKKKEYLTTMEQKIAKLEGEKMMFKRENERLKQRVQALESERAIMRASRFPISSRNSTVLMGLIVFMVFNLTPMMSIFSGSTFSSPSTSLDLTRGISDKTFPGVETNLNGHSRSRRSLLWFNKFEEPLGKDVIGNASHICPRYINATESIRIDNELRDIFEIKSSLLEKNFKNESTPNNVKFDQVSDGNKLENFEIVHPKMRNLRRNQKDGKIKKMELKEHDLKDSALTTASIRTDENRPNGFHYTYRMEEPTYGEPNDAKHSPSLLTSHSSGSSILDSIHRRDDTYYVVSFSRSDHFLFPALSRNASVRPKMSLLVPTPKGLDPSKDEDVMSFTQIDCEVMHTHLVRVDSVNSQVSNELSLVSDETVLKNQIHYARNSYRRNKKDVDKSGNFVEEPHLGVEEGKHVFDANSTNSNFFNQHKHSTSFDKKIEQKKKTKKLKRKSLA